MLKKLSAASALDSPEDGETVVFGFEYDGGSREVFEAPHAVMVEVADVLMAATKECANKRRKLGKPFKPVSAVGIVRQLDLSAFSILPGRDGLPRLTFTLDNGSGTVIRMSWKDIRRWRDMMTDVIDSQGSQASAGEDR